MEKKQDSGLSCFMIVMKFHGIPITKEQAQNLSVLDTEQKTGEAEIIQSAKALKMKAKLCKLKISKLKNVKAPIIAKGKNGDYFIIAKSSEDNFMILLSYEPVRLMLMAKPFIRTDSLKITIRVPKMLDLKSELITTAVHIPKRDLREMLMTF